MKKISELTCCWFKHLETSTVLMPLKRQRETLGTTGTISSASRICIKITIFLNYLFYFFIIFFSLNKYLCYGSISKGTLIVFLMQ